MYQSLNKSLPFPYLIPNQPGLHISPRIRDRVSAFTGNLCCEVAGRPAPANIGAAIVDGLYISPPSTIRDLSSNSV